MFENSKENLYAVMIDIDKFKKINDAYGHPMGDKVIKSLAKTIADNLCVGSVFGRLGGEEFAILCAKDTTDQVAKKIEELRQSVEDIQIYSDSGDRIFFTISEGIAKATPEMRTIDDLLKEADAALYEAKGEGRNRIKFR